MRLEFGLQLNQFEIIQNLWTKVSYICFVLSSQAVTDFRIGQIGHGVGPPVLGPHTTPSFDNSLLT